MEQRRWLRRVRKDATAPAPVAAGNLPVSAEASRHTVRGPGHPDKEERLLPAQLILLSPPHVSWPPRIAPLERQIPRRRWNTTDPFATEPSGYRRPEDSTPREVP